MIYALLDNLDQKLGWLEIAPIDLVVYDQAVMPGYFIKAKCANLNQYYYFCYKE